MADEHFFTNILNIEGVKRLMKAGEELREMFNGVEDWEPAHTEKAVGLVLFFTGLSFSPVNTPQVIIDTMNDPVFAMDSFGALLQDVRSLITYGETPEGYDVVASDEFKELMDLILRGES